MILFDKIKHFLETNFALSGKQNESEDQLKVASAALLMEMMYAEETFEQEKQGLVLNMLKKTFSLTEEQASILMEMANDKRQQATDYFEFTHLICTTYTPEQKIQLIESLWKIAFSDNNLDMDEEYLIDKIARLLYIPRDQVVLAKNRARAA